MPGFLANGISCRIKTDGNKDFSLIVSHAPARVAVGRGIKVPAEVMKYIMDLDEILVTLHLGMGLSSWRVLASDLTHE